MSAPFVYEPDDFLDADIKISDPSTSRRKKRSRGDWKTGWARSETCPPELYVRRAGERTVLPADEHGVHQGPHWQALHADQAAAQNLCRQAGFAARNAWRRTLDIERCREVSRAKKRPCVIPYGVASASELEAARDAGIDIVVREPDPGDLRLSRDPIMRYDDGPASGLASIDPWVMAEELLHCARSFWHTLRRRTDGTLTSVRAPRFCNRQHVCAICGTIRAGRIASALRQLIRAAVAGDGHLFLVTLTQAAERGEPLVKALARLREAMGAFVRGRPARRWQTLVAGSAYCIEVTWSWPGKHRGRPMPPPDECHWHVHVHIIVSFKAGIDPAVARRVLVGLWARATRRVAKARGIAKGWTPISGGAKPGTTAGEWFKEIAKTGDLDEVKQVAKYPTNIPDLPPLQLAEYLAVVHGRRMRDGSGCLQGIVKRAEALPKSVSEIERLLGECICVPFAFRDSVDTRVSPAIDPEVRFLLKGKGNVDEVPDDLLVEIYRRGGYLRRAAAGVGRERLVLFMPAAWVVATASAMDRQCRDALRLSTTQTPPERPEQDTFLTAAVTWEPPRPREVKRTPAQLRDSILRKPPIPLHKGRLLQRAE